MPDSSLLANMAKGETAIIYPIHQSFCPQQIRYAYKPLMWKRNMWNIRASINNIIHFRRYNWCLIYVCCLLSQSSWTTGRRRCTIWYTRMVSVAYLTKISGTTSWITMILINITHKTSKNTETTKKKTKWHVNMWVNRNKSSAHKNLPVFLLIICKVSHSFTLNNSLQLCWEHNTLYKCGESSQHS